MAGVGKKILSLFVEYETEPEKKQKTSEEKPVRTEAPPGRPVQTAFTSGASDEVIARNIAAALEKANLQGFDYFEYAKTIDALKASIPAEQALFQTAFASGSVMGATKKALLDSAGHYLSVLDGEAAKFAEMVKVRFADTVKGREEQIQGINDQIGRKAEQINALNAEINQLTTQKNTLMNEAAENRIKIEKVQNDFSATLQIFIGKIRADVEKIEKYIAG